MTWQGIRSKLRVGFRNELASRRVDLWEEVSQYDKSCQLSSCNGCIEYECRYESLATRRDA